MNNHYATIRQKNPLVDHTSMKVRLGLEFQTKLKIQATTPIIVLATNHLSKLRLI